MKQTEFKVIVEYVMGVQFNIGVMKIEIYMIFDKITFLVCGFGFGNGIGFSING